MAEHQVVGFQHVQGRTLLRLVADLGHASGDVTGDGHGAHLVMFVDDEGHVLAAGHAPATQLHHPRRRHHHRDVAVQRGNDPGEGQRELGELTGRAGGAVVADHGRYLIMIWRGWPHEE